MHLSLSVCLEQGSRVQHNCFFLCANTCCVLLLIKTGSLWFAALHGSAACEVQLCSEIQVMAVTGGVTSFDVGGRIRSGLVSLPSPHLRTLHHVCHLLKNENMSGFFAPFLSLGILYLVPAHNKGAVYPRARFYLSLFLISP